MNLVTPAFAANAAVSSLRERKKQRTRQRIADAAQALFASRGFDQVTVADVAQNADVSEQTVYNYFATKEALVLDESEVFAARFRAMVLERGESVSLLQAVRAEAIGLLTQLARRPQSAGYRGSMPYLVATCPPIRRHWLALLERFAQIVATALVDDSNGKLALPTARVLGGAIISIFAVIIDEVGQAMVTEVPIPVRLRAVRRQIERAIDQMANGFA
jgi:AcrR family transcriptional regulator